MRYRIWTGMVALPALLAACNYETAALSTDVVTSELTPEAGAEALEFDSPSGWELTEGSAQALEVQSPHTSGTGSLAIVAPAGYTRIESGALPSSVPSLAGIARGASFAIDLLLPVQQPNPYWYGAMQMYVSCPSRNIYNAYLGQIELTGKRTGVFQTHRFAIPDYVADALAGAAYSDLKVGVVLNVPSGGTGTYHLDRLRLKDVVVPRPAGLADIQSGESISLLAWREEGVGEAAAERSFPAGIIQIPRSLRVVRGSSGNGTAVLEWSSPGVTTLVPPSCEFRGDGGSPVSNYVLASCSGGLMAGDLVPADHVRLAVRSGDASAGRTKIKAQIALNPAGDELIALPPIPTYFGESTAEVESALAGFFAEQAKVRVEGVVPIRLPTPDIERRQSVIENGELLPTPPPADNDPPFAKDGRLSNTDLADAHWYASGTLAVPISATERATKFDAKVGVDVYLLGVYVPKVLEISASLKSSRPMPGVTAASSSSGQVCYEDIVHARQCVSVDAARNGQKLFDKSHPATFVKLPFGPFSVEGGGTLSYSATVAGGFTPEGIGVTVTPEMKVTAWLRGGLSVAFFGGGGLFGEVDLLTASVPMHAVVEADADTNPNVCKLLINHWLDAKAEVSMGAGRIGFWYELGLTCGLWDGGCIRGSETLVNWPALKTLEYPIVLADETVDAQIDLPRDACPLGADAYFSLPLPNETFTEGQVSAIVAGVRTTYYDPDKNTPIYGSAHHCALTSSQPSDVIVMKGGTCSASIQYGAPGPRTLTVTGFDQHNVIVGTEDTTVNVLATPAGAPTNVRIVTPAGGVSNGGCTSRWDVEGIATDAQGRPLQYEWYTGSGTTWTSRGLGYRTSLALPQGTYRLRLRVTNQEGQSSYAEVPFWRYCVK